MSTNARSSSSRRVWRSAKPAAISTDARGRSTISAEATRGLGDLDRARDYYRRGLEAATEIGLAEGQLWALFGIAELETETGDALVGARLLGRTKALASRLGAGDEHDGIALERRTLATLETELGPERLASELAAGAALSLEDAISLALRTGPQ